VKSVWKGLVIGGLTGVAAGVILDVLDQGSGLARAASKRAAGRAAGLAPRAADRIKSAASTGATKLHEAELGDHVKELANRLAEAETSEHARDTLGRVTKRGAELVHAVRDSVPAASGE